MNDDKHVIVIHVKRNQERHGGIVVKVFFLPYLHCMLIILEVLKILVGDGLQNPIHVAIIRISGFRHKVQLLRWTLQKSYHWQAEKQKNL